MMTSKLVIIDLLQGKRRSLDLETICGVVVEFARRFAQI